MTYSFFKSVGMTGSCWRLILLLGCCAIAGCAREKPNAPGNAAAPARPPVEVDVVPAIERQITDYREYTGRTAAAFTVEVRARVSGYLLQSPQSKTINGKSEVTNGAKATPVETVVTDQGFADSPPFKVLVHEGDIVQPKTPLFEIDPEPYKLALSQAVGNLNASNALLTRYELDLERNVRLLQSNSISKSDYDLAVANREATRGQIENLRAIVDRARLDLSYTRIVSPIFGIVGRSMITNGNLVTADSTVLTSIVSLDPIYVYFDVDENSLLDYRARIRVGTVQSARDSSIPIRLGLANETGHPHSGVIDFVNNTTDPGTGNTQIRGSFPNADGALSPGLFARIQAPFSAAYTGTLVPTKALAMDQQGRYLMVVGEDQIAHRREIVPGTAHGEWTVIGEGLKPNEVVVVAGLQKIRDGDKVKTRDVSEQIKPLAEESGTAR